MGKTISSYDFPVVINVKIFLHHIMMLEPVLSNEVSNNEDYLCFRIKEQTYCRHSNIPVFIHKDDFNQFDSYIKKSLTETFKENK